MYKRFSALIVGALALSLLAAGCGGGGDSDSTSSLTKAQFLKQADSVCEKGSEAIEGEVQDYAKENGIPTDKEPSDEVKEELVTEVIVPNIERQAEALDAIGAPNGEEDEVAEIIEGIKTAAAETADDPSAVIAGKEGAFEDVNQLAEKYGLEVCGEG